MHPTTRQGTAGKARLRKTTGARYVCSDENKMHAAGWPRCVITLVVVCAGRGVAGLGVNEIGTLPPSRLLVAYVAGRDNVSMTRARGVHRMWSTMQVMARLANSTAPRTAMCIRSAACGRLPILYAQLELGRWSLRCLFVFGGLTEQSEHNFTYSSDSVNMQAPILATHWLAVTYMTP